MSSSRKVSLHVSISCALMCCSVVGDIECSKNHNTELQKPCRVKDQEPPVVVPYKVSNKGKQGSNVATK